jgi:hypothetical protein
MNITNNNGNANHAAHFNEAVCEWVNATHFITLSLCQGRAIPNENGGVSWLRGDDTIYTQMHTGFMESLSKRLATRTAWKHHRAILRSAFAIEGGTNGQLVHAHLIVAKPDELDEVRFRIMFYRNAARNPWCMNGAYAVRIRGIESVAEKSCSARYTTKDGFDRMSFT